MVIALSLLAIAGLALVQRGFVQAAPGAWDDEILEQAVVYANGQYYLWYSGWRGELKPDTAISIGLATSSDGIHWTRHARFIGFWSSR